jgi:hypothetical protein
MSIAAHRVLLCFIGNVLATALSFDPCAMAEAWRPVGSTQDGRESSGLVVLPDGRVLVAGGHPLTRHNPGGERWRVFGTSELYNPRTETWVSTGSLVEPRNGIGTLALLANGKVLLAGEHDTRTGCELFDPSTGTWTRTGPLNTGRGVHQTTLLLDGRVLVSGGIDYSQRPEPIFASAELYDPATGTWTATGSMIGPRFKHRAVLLRDGRVLVAGGTATEPSRDPPLATAELYDPVSGIWRQTGPMNQARENPGIALLRDGRVLVAGGAVGNFGEYRSLNSAEIYDPRTETWTETASMKQDRVQFPVVLLADGRVLAIGGVARPRGTALLSVEAYDPASGTWSDVAPMAVRRWNHRAVLLPNEEVLVVGGFNITGELRDAEVFTPR